MEIVFGDPEARPCDLLPPEAFPAPEDIRPDPGVRRRGGTSDEDTLFVRSERPYRLTPSHHRQHLRRAGPERRL